MNESEAQTINAPRDFMNDSFDDGKASKITELSSEMSITPTAPDEYENKISNVGGNA